MIDNIKLEENPLPEKKNKEEDHTRKIEEEVGNASSFFLFFSRAKKIKRRKRVSSETPVYSFQFIDVQIPFSFFFYKIIYIHE